MEVLDAAGDIQRDGCSYLKVNECKADCTAYMLKGHKGSRNHKLMGREGKVADGPRWNVEGKV